MDNKVKHLEFIQVIIARMNSNSFMLKGWTVTLVVGLFALDLTNKSIPFLKISFLPIIIFWVLDGFYLYKERMFRKLYDKVRKMNDNEIDFNMHREADLKAFFCAIALRTVPIFYGTLLLSVGYILFKGG